MGTFDDAIYNILGNSDTTNPNTMTGGDLTRSQELAKMFADRQAPADRLGGGSLPMLGLQDVFNPMNAAAWRNVAHGGELASGKAKSDMLQQHISTMYPQQQQPSQAPVGPGFVGDPNAPFNMEQYKKEMIRGESGGDPNSTGGGPGPKQNKGIYQFNQDDAKEFGVPPGTDLRDPAAQERMFQLETQRNLKMFQDRFGRPPTRAEMHIMHQQGIGGGMALIAASKDPNVKAVDVLASLPGSSRELAVKKLVGNGMDPNSSAAQAAQHIGGYYTGGATQQAQQQQSPMIRTLPSGQTAMVEQPSGLTPQAVSQYMSNPIVSNAERDAVAAKVEANNKVKDLAIPGGQVQISPMTPQVAARSTEPYHTTVAGMPAVTTLGPGMQPGTHFQGADTMNGPPTNANDIPAAVAPIVKAGAAVEGMKQEAATPNTERALDRDAGLKRNQELMSTKGTDEEALSKLDLMEKTIKGKDFADIARGGHVGRIINEVGIVTDYLTGGKLNFQSTPALAGKDMLNALTSQMVTTDAGRQVDRPSQAWLQKTFSSLPNLEQSRDGMYVVAQLAKQSVERRQGIRNAIEKAIEKDEKGTDKVSPIRSSAKAISEIEAKYIQEHPFDLKLLDGRKVSDIAKEEEKRAKFKEIEAKPAQRVESPVAPEGQEPLLPGQRRRRM